MRFEVPAQKPARGFEIRPLGCHDRGGLQLGEINRALKARQSLISGYLAAVCMPVQRNAATSVISRCRSGWNDYEYSNYPRANLAHRRLL